MERALSSEEKIRRAEEIYERRRNQNYRNTTATVNVSGNNKDFKLLKKMIIQILICLLIYFIFYLIQSTNYVFSATTINKTKEILDYDMDVKGMYNEIKNNFINIKEENSIPENETNKNINEENNNNQENDVQNADTTEQNNTEENKENEIQQDNKEEANLEEKNKEEIKEPEKEESENNEIDNKKEETITLAKEILNNYSIIKPANGGFISSEFGTREAEGEIVTTYHHGIDIGVITGTEVMAATEGKVILATQSSSYGNYIKIQNGELVTLYAHCNELLVNVGDTVKQGDIIAKSGATGNVTGPHLHFEIIYKGEYINPREILEF